MGDFAPLMLDGLEAAASKGNALAHYALSLIHAPDDDEDTDQGAGRLEALIGIRRNNKVVC